jgi:iron complex outermembrane receptor protein
MTAALSLHADDGASATLAGKVTDPSAAVLQGAQVQVTQRATGAISSAATDNSGSFVLRDLPPGRYDVAVESAGFAEFHRDGLVVDAGRTVELDIVLQVAQVRESVLVTAKAPADEGTTETQPQNSREILEIREVRESSAKDVGEAVANLEGLWKIRKGGIANDVVLRGFQQGNINVLIDGSRINGACPNHMDPSAYHADFAEIETVQVTKGPFDIRNQGSLGGTVDLVSRKPVDGFQATPNLSTGSFGFWNPSLTGAYSNGKLHASAGYSYRRSEAYRDGAGRRATGYAAYTDAGGERDAFSVNTGWLKFGAALPAGQSVDFNYTRQQGGLTLYPYLLMDAGYDNADRAGARWSIREVTARVRRVQVEFSFSQVKHWMTDELRTSSAGAARGFSMATFAATKVLGARVEAESGTTLAGFEGYRRNWNAVNTMRMSGVYSDQPSMPDVEMWVGGSYVQHRRTFGNLRLTAGARLDAASSDARSQALSTDLYWAYQGTCAITKTDLTPSTNFTLAYSAGKGLELFGGAGSVARLPDPEERFYALRRGGTDWVGNPNLKPARNSEADLGINYRTGRFSLRPTVFYSRLDNFVALHSQPVRNLVMGIMNKAARSYEGVAARIYGGEASWSVALSRALLLTGGVSYVRGGQSEKTSAGMAGGNIAEMPPLKSRASLRYGNRLFFTELEGRAVARQNLVDRSLLEQPTAGYALLGIRGGIHRKRWNLAVGVDNLLNRLYFDHLSFLRDPFRTGIRIPDPGRSVYINLSIPIK